ncbi:MAG: hypothetical protein IID44_07450 [Planctomycetes bacterium]|nr:hypothetical protein [Planctomycetota bacterium]
MAISETIERAKVDDLYLDPRNPRLGRRLTCSNPSQDVILQWMLENGVLEELAVSFIESGFWTQEALIVVEEEIGRRRRLVVAEGNRRLAALKILFAACRGEDVPPRWVEIAKSVNKNQLKRLESVPFVRADSRKAVQAYHGFRNVSGIKEWNPAEKAEFIAHLIDDEGLSYEQVARLVGSKAPTVRQNYISYRILLQMEKQDEISIQRVEDRFSVLFLSLRTEGVQTYLEIDMRAEPGKAVRPVPRRRLKQLANFACWLFGHGDDDPLVRDSRQTDDFGKILESAKAVAYLERAERPTFERAYRMAGGDEAETAKHIERAADEVEEALGTAHLHKKSKRLRESTERLGRHVLQLLELFPGIKRDLLGKGE